MKTIIAFLGIMLLWVSSPVFAANCPAGTYVNSSECKVCAEGTYSTQTNASTCQQCPEPYTYTVGDTAEDHDKLADCLIPVTFHGNGGKYKNKNSQLVEDAETVAAYPPLNIKIFGCSIKLIDGNEPKDVKMCETRSNGFRITTPTKSYWTRENYTFAGWYKDPGAETQLVSKNDVFTEDTDLYAKWCSTADHFAPKDGKCVCDKGYYASTDEETGTVSCIKCMGNNTTTANVGATSENDCVCKLGFTYVAQGSPLGGDGVTMECTKCPSGTTTYNYGDLACEPIKEYKYGSAPGTKWKWPDTVTIGKIKITGNP